MKRINPGLLGTVLRIIGNSFSFMKPKGVASLVGRGRNRWIGLGPRYTSLSTIHKRIGTSKYMPHQGARECLRRRLGGFAGK